MASHVNSLHSEFTEERIRNELSRFGFNDINRGSLRQFQEELQNLVKQMTSSSLQNVDTSTRKTSTTSSSFINIIPPYTCSNLSSSLSPPTPFTTTSPLLAPTTTIKNVDNVKKTRPVCTTSHTDTHSPVNSLEPLSAIASYNRSQNAGGISGHVTDRNAGFFSAAKNVADVRSRPTCTSQIGTHSSVHSSEPSSVTTVYDNSQNAAERSRCVACRNAKFLSADRVDGHSKKTSSRHNNRQIDRKPNLKSKRTSVIPSTEENVPQPGQNKENIWSHQLVSSSTSSLVTKPSQMTSITTESNTMTNYLQDVLNKPASLVNTFVTKRKISRKGPDGKRYVDESESACSSSVSSINSCCSSSVDPAEYLNRLREMTNRDTRFYHRSISSSDGRPRSTIIVAPTPPRRKKTLKTDPVKRFHEFQNYWNLYKAPGEDNHNALRWSIREKIAKRDVIESRPRKTFVPNNYEIPSQKPRHSLRWQIRTDMAYGFMPSAASHNDY